MRRNAEVSRSKRHAGEIDISGAAIAGAAEFLRMWAEPNGPVVCLIDPTVIGPDPMGFGLALVDAARHGAKAYAHATGVDEETVFARILEGLEMELANPTDEAREVGVSKRSAN